MYVIFSMIWIETDGKLFMDSTNSGGFDASLLEGLPINQFNWGEWNVSPIYLFFT